MDTNTQIAGHGLTTIGAWFMSNWTEIGAAILMIMQGGLLAWKYYDKWKGKGDKDGD